MIITLTGFKGGVGKTTTAIHLAAILHKKAPTLLVDGDPNRSASRWAERGQLPFVVANEGKAPKLMQTHEHIVIDTQARPTLEELTDLSEGCDLLILPTTPDALALDALMLTIDTLKQLKANQYKVLLTIVPPSPSRDGEESRSMLHNAGVSIFDSFIRRYVAFQKAALAGCLVCDANDPRAGIAWRDYEAIGKEIL